MLINYLQRIKINIKMCVRERETERGRERERDSRHKSIILVPPTRVVQSPCTFKGFHYNHTRLQLLKDTINRISNAQAQKQETFNAQSQLKGTSKSLQINNFVLTRDIQS